MLVLALLMLACEEEAPSPAQLVLSTWELDLGTATPGELREGTLTIANEGGVSLGLASLGLVGAPTGFEIHWDPGEMQTLRRAPPPPDDTADTSGPHIPPDPGDFILVLPPHTSLDVRVSFTPMQPGESWGALWMETEDEPWHESLLEIPEEQRIHRDHDNTEAMVYLHGRSTVSRTSPQPSYLVGGRIQVDHTGVEPGGTVHARAVYAGGLDEAQPTWSSTGGTLHDADGTRISWTAPSEDRSHTEALQVNLADGSHRARLSLDVFREGALIQ